MPSFVMELRMMRASENIFFLVSASVFLRIREISSGLRWVEVASL